MLESSYESLKTNIRAHNLEESVQQLLLLYTADGKSFIRKLLLSGTLIEPITLGVKEQDIQFMNRVFITAFKLVEDREGEGFNNFIQDSSRLIKSINIIYQAIKENNELLLENEFLKYPFKKQVQMYCTFIESQSIYTQRHVEDNIKHKEYFTGLEKIVAEEGRKHSVSDNLEAIIDLFDTLIRLLQYNSKGNIEGQLHKTYSDVSPYLIPSLEMIMHLTTHKQSLDILWEKIKYRDWRFSLYKTQDGNDVFYYVPKNDYNFKVEKAANIRYKYNEYLDYITNVDFKVTNKAVTEIQNKIKFPVDKPRELFNLDSKLIKLCYQIYKPRLNSSIKKMKEKLGDRFLSIRIGYSKTISLSDLYDCFGYLLSLAHAYSHNSSHHFNDTDFSFLTPVFDVKHLVEGLIKHCDMEEEKANEIIDLYIFKPKYIKENLDIFSQPLIYVGDNQIVFCPYLIEQMNLDRIVEKHLNAFEIQLSSKGTNLEKRLNSIMNLAPYFKVNNSKIKFEAYDQKQVEYDMVGVMGDKILLIELKCITRPYSDYEIHEKEREILFGVEQVNRREKILINQPEIVQEYMDINLPTSSPTKDDIIKIVCTDIFDFTGRTEGDVYITDTSVFMKFFLDPSFKQIEVHNEEHLVKSVKKIYSKKPSSKELIEYLQLPIALKPFLPNLVEEPHPILLLSEHSYSVAFKDYIIRNNPFEESIKTRQPSKKIGRNEKCPCNSGKKYKKCCGR